MKMSVEFNSIEEVKEFASIIIGGKNQIIKIDTEDIVPVGQEKLHVKKDEAVDEPKDVKEEPKSIEEIKEDKKEETPKLTKETIRAMFSKLIQAGKQKTAKEITMKYGAKKVNELKEEDYPAVYADIEEELK